MGSTYILVDGVALKEVKHELDAARGAPLFSGIVVDVELEFIAEVLAEVVVEKLVRSFKSANILVDLKIPSVRVNVVGLVRVPEFDETLRLGIGYEARTFANLAADLVAIATKIVGNGG